MNYKLYKTYPFLSKEAIVHLPYSKFQKSSKIPAEIKKNLNQMKKLNRFVHVMLLRGNGKPFPWLLLG